MYSTVKTAEIVVLERQINRSGNKREEEQILPFMLKERKKETF